MRTERDILNDGHDAEEEEQKNSLIEVEGKRL
jgi:hypothetical protein